MDRYFDADPEEKNSTPKRDRIYFRLKQDHSVKIFKSDRRPFLEMAKPEGEKKEKKKKKLFETGDEEVKSFKDQFKASKIDRSFYEVDGVWAWKDGAPRKVSQVQIETREGSGKEKIMHDVVCEWGSFDQYAAKFREGKILKYKMSKTGLPLGTKQIGSFSIRVSPHRPLVSKEFMAFQ